MTWVLAVLGVLAVVGGYIGLPILWGLPNFFERWLEPVFESIAPPRPLGRTAGTPPSGG